MTITARQRKLVQDGAKGVAERWVGDPEDAARARVKFRSSIKRYSGKEAELPERAEAADPGRHAQNRSIRAEQAATGMMGPPPTTFDEGAIKDWLGKMSAEDLQKLSGLTEIARQGKEGGRTAWSKVDSGLEQQRKATQHYSRAGGHGKEGDDSRGGDSGLSDDWGRTLSRLKDFING